MLCTLACAMYSPVISLSAVFSVALENYSTAKLAQVLGKFRLIIKEMVLSCFILLLFARTFRPSSPALPLLPSFMCPMKVI